jgi:hypothetical protein
VLHLTDNDGSCAISLSNSNTFTCAAVLGHVQLTTPPPADHDSLSAAVRRPGRRDRTAACPGCSLVAVTAPALRIPFCRLAAIVLQRRPNTMASLSLDRNCIAGYLAFSFVVFVYWPVRIFS